MYGRTRERGGKGRKGEERGGKGRKGEERGGKGRQKRKDARGKNILVTM